MEKKTFANKEFNPQAFGYLTEKVEKVRKNVLAKTGAFKRNEQVERILTEQNGSQLGRIVMKAGLTDKKAMKYDGKTDLTDSTTTKTLAQNVACLGYAQVFEELDFSQDLIGEDFMSDIAKEVVGYFEDVEQDQLLAMLKGIFAMTGTDEDEFVKKHTLDISSESDPTLNPATLNKAMQKACGDKKGDFSVVIVHSAVATDLENKNLLQHLKYTDEKGVERDLTLSYWNGKLLIEDDTMPEENGVYTSYVLGNGAFLYGDLDVRVPYEVDRDPSKKGGASLLYARKRKYLAPKFISYESTVECPDATELEKGATWKLATDTENNAVDDKLIKIAQIKCKTETGAAARTVKK